MSAKPTTPILDTVILLTTKLDPMVDFYRHGFELVNEQSHGDYHKGFRLHNFYLGFDRVGESEMCTPGPISLWFAVDDLEATYQRFIDLGARSQYPPTHKPWGGYLAAVYDPDGNTVGLAQGETNSRQT